MAAHYTRQQRAWLARGLTSQGRVRQRASQLQGLAESHTALLAACERQVANIERWLETGVPATADESESIYGQMVDAIAKAKGEAP